MVTPISKTYGSVDGLSIYGGMTPSGGGGATPAWLTASGNTVNKVVAIPGITNGGGATMTAWGSFDIRQTTGEIFVGPQAGHGDGYWNGVTKFNATADTPSWSVVNTPTPVGQLITDGFYYADGKPGSRHMYDHWHWDHITDLFIMIGGSGTWPNGFNVQASDGFNPVTNLWDAPGTWPYIDATGFGTVIDTLRGEIWTNGFKRVSTTSKTYLTNNTTPTVGARYPVSYDSLRDQMFTLLWGDGGPAGPSNTLVAGKWACTGGVEQTVTFNSSAAYSQFVSEALVSSYAGMTYNTDLDVFYWTSGYSTSQGHIYVITPNNTTTWDMSLFNFAAGSATLDAAPNAGINGRLKYHKLLKGIVINPSGSGQWYFIKTS